MTTILIRPQRLAVALSELYGHCKPEPETPLRWFPCPNCRPGVQRMTICATCNGLGRIPALQC